MDVHTNTHTFTYNTHICSGAIGYAQVLMVLEYLTALIPNSPEQAQYMIPTVQRQRSATYALQEGRHGTLL